MSRLPVPGQDFDVWGDVLNDFLSVELNSDGSLRRGGDIDNAETAAENAQSAASAAQTTANSAQPISQRNQANGYAPLDANGLVPAANLPATGSVPDATTSTKGVVQLAGDLSGTAAAPTVPGLAAKYVKPGTGIPETDLAASVQTALTSADSALQSANNLSDVASPATALSNLGGVSATAANQLYVPAFLVTHYGAAGDGVNDDTNAIQNAINAAAAVSGSSSAGAVVYFPTGTYKITAQLTIGASNLTFAGAGFGASAIQQSTAGTHAFYAQNLRNFVFRDLKITGPSGGAGDGIYLSATSSNAIFDCVFSNLEISNFGRYGIHTEDLCTSVFGHVRVDSCGTDGFHIADNGTSGLGGTSLTFESCYANACANAGYYLSSLKYSSLNGCATDSCNYGYFVNLCSGLNFSACGAEATTGSAGHGFLVANGTTSIVLDGCWLTNIEAGTGIGYYVTANGGSNCSRIIIVGCRVQGGIVPLYSAQVDASSQAVFIGFQPHPSAGLNILGSAQFLAHDNTGLTAYGQVPVSTDEPFVAWMPDTGTYGFGTSVVADSVRRWAVRSDGHTEWGTGAATRDTNLYRSAASTLRTDSTFVAANINVGTPSAASKIYLSYADSSSPSVGLQMQETAGTLNGTAMQIMQASSTSKRVFDIMVTGDTSRRLSINGGGTINFGSGSALDTNLYRSATSTLATDNNFAIRSAGSGLQIKEGSNAKMGTGTLSSGTVTISNSSVTNTSRIFLTTYIAGGTVGALYVSAKVSGTSFSVTSTSATDTSTFNYLIVEPAA